MEREKPSTKRFFEIIFFVGCLFFILAFVYLKLSKKNHLITNIFSPIALPSIALNKSQIYPTKIPQKKQPEQPVITEYFISEEGISSKITDIKLHDFITFKNTTQNKVTITFIPGVSTNLLPNSVWTRSFEAIGEYQFTVKGLSKDFEYKISIK